MCTDADLFALRQRYGRRLPVRTRGAAVCAVCSAVLAPDAVRCPAHPGGEVFIMLEDTHEAANRCPVCGVQMYAVEVEEGIYALPCFHWLYGHSQEETDATR